MQGIDQGFGLLFLGGADAVFLFVVFVVDHDIVIAEIFYQSGTSDIVEVDGYISWLLFANRAGAFYISCSNLDMGVGDGEFAGCLFYGLFLNYLAHDINRVFVCYDFRLIRHGCCAGGER